MRVPLQPKCRALTHSEIFIFKRLNKNGYNFLAGHLRQGAQCPPAPVCVRMISLLSQRWERCLPMLGKLLPIRPVTFNEPLILPLVQLPLEFSLSPRAIACGV